MPDVTRTITNWENMGTAGLHLTKFALGDLKTDYSRKGEAGCWLYLEGLTYDDLEAHITVTKKVDDLNWEFCHLTVTRAKASHAFYQVANDGTFRSTTTLMSQLGKQTNGRTHYSNDQINDPTLRNDVDGDLTLIFNHLVT